MLYVIQFSLLYDVDSSGSIIGTFFLVKQTSSYILRNELPNILWPVEIQSNEVIFISYLWYTYIISIKVI